MSNVLNVMSELRHYLPMNEESRKAKMTQLIDGGFHFKFQLNGRRVIVSQDGVTVYDGEARGLSAFLRALN